MSDRIEYTHGQKIGECIFLNDEPYKVYEYGRIRMAKFRCRCGKEYITRLSYVINGYSLSCGCYNREMTSLKLTKHKLIKSAEYRTWSSMRERCLNKNNQDFKHYGGRGIAICERWLNLENGFLNFFADMGKKPTPKHSIDRINTNGNYEPNNCKWSTHTEQVRNTNRNHYITHNGETKCLTEWAEQLGINAGTLSGRLLNYGYTFEEAINPNFKRRPFGLRHGNL